MKTAVRFLSILLVMVLMMGCLPLAHAEETEVIFSEMPAITTFAEGISAYALDGSVVALKSGNYENWIDRLDLSGADYAMEFYEWLDDNAEADGALVDFSKLDTYTDSYGIHYSHPVAAFTFAMSDDMNELNAIMSSNMDEAWAYIAAVTTAFDRDHPEVFWFNGNFTGYGLTVPGRNEDGDSVYIQTVYIDYLNDSFDSRGSMYQDTAAIQSAIVSRDSFVEGILSRITGDSRYEKLRQINEILTTENCYNVDLSSADDNAYECISALGGYTGTSGPVCEGYARAFKVICDQLGIPCVLVNGDANNGETTESHMWNYVQMEDGKWYAVDVTWNDPVVDGITGMESGYENEDYLLVGSNTVIDGLTFSASHFASNIHSPFAPAFTNGPVLAEEAYVPAGAGGTGDSCADGHTYGDPVFTWDEDYNCTAVFSCLAGDDEQTLFCNVSSVVVDPTETEDGKVTYTATVEFGGIAYSDVKEVEIPATGHLIHIADGVWQFDADSHWQGCTGCAEKVMEEAHSGGSATCAALAVCSDCGASYGSLSSTVHGGGTETLNAKDATEFEDGYTGDIYCLGCGELLASGTMIPATHTHSYTAVTVDATCTEDGSITYTCTCGDTSAETIPATGHIFADGTCSVCGQAEEVQGNLGDADGDGKISSTDARLVLQYTVSLITGSDLMLDSADVDGDGKVTSTDARLILQFSVNLITEFPAA